MTDQPKHRLIFSRKRVVTRMEIMQDYKVTIDASLLREAFDLPENATIEFYVPTGGDYSGMTLSLDEYPVIARYSRTVKEEPSQ